MDGIKLNYEHKADRGAHVYWLEKGTVETRPDHILNLIHYEVTMSFFYIFILLCELWSYVDSLFFSCNLY